MLNCQILEVNGIKIEDVLEKISCIVPPNSRSYSLIWQESFLMLNGILEYYGITKNKTAKFLLKYPEGIIKEKQVDAESKQFLGGVYYYQDNQPYYWINFSTFGRPDNYFRDTLYVKDSIYFIQYNVCSSREVVMKYRSMNEEEAKQFPSFTEFRSRILKNLKSDKVNKVLFDLRFNSGGSSEQGTELVDRIAEIPNINKKGKLFVAISWITFSSAVMNSMDFRLNTQAILIGKPTGSKPNHYGEVKTLILPKTKLTLSYSSKHFKYIDEDVDAVFPDIEIDSEFEDYLNAVDPMYEFVKNYK